MLKATSITITAADADEAQDAASPVTVRMQPQPRAVAMRDVPTMAGDGRLLRVVTRRIAGLSHPLEEMAGAVPLELNGPGGRRLSVAVAHGPEVRIETRTAGMYGVDRLTLNGMAELRALAAVLNAAIAAVEVHDELQDFNDEAAAMLAQVQAPTATSPKRTAHPRRA